MENRMDNISDTVEDISKRISEIKGENINEEENEMHERSKIDDEEMEKVKKDINDTRDKIREELWEKVEDPHSNYPGFRSEKEDLFESTEKDEEKHEGSEEVSDKEAIDKKVEKVDDSLEETGLTEKEQRELDIFYEKFDYAKKKIVEGDFEHLEKIYKSLLKDYRHLKSLEIATKKEKNALKKIYSKLNKY